MVPWSPYWLRPTVHNLSGINYDESVEIHVDKNVGKYVICYTMRKNSGL